MTSPDPHRHDAPDEGPAEASTRGGSPDAAPARRRPGWLTEPDESGTGQDTVATGTDEDDPTSTADRRQGFLGLHRAETEPPQDAATPPRPAAEPATAGTATPASPQASATGSTSSETAPGVATSSRSPVPAESPARTESLSGSDEELRRRWSGEDRESTADSSDAVLAGATQAKPRSRAPAHWWSLIISVLLAPVAWYLVADAGARLTLGEDSPWATGEISVAAVIELAAGLVVVAVVLLAARWSALGATVMGVVVLLAGAAFIGVPAQTATSLDPVLTWLEDWNAFGGNVAHHVQEDGPTGRLALYGLTLLLVGVVAAGARRHGRAEQRRREAYERRKRSA